MSEELTYRGSGVDIKAGYEAVRKIKAHAQTTWGPQVLADIGLFGGAFELPPDKFRRPVLISGTDGVGTKLKVAFMTGRHKDIGIDAVAYCINDIICQGAEPLFFLDYLALGRLDIDVVERIVAGIAEGCREAGCALIGGETAEMPGLYNPGEYDVAGFAVGIVERDRMIDGRRVEAGDQIIGIASTGLQSSGFSLVRQACFDRANLTVDEWVPELGQTVGDVLMTPTGIYVRAVQNVLDQCDVKGIANISGGGIPENVPRAMSKQTNAVIDRTSWPIPPVFSWVQRLGRISDDEMFNTFNMGIGMAVIVGPDEAPRAQKALTESGWDSWIIGSIVPGDGELVMA